MLGLDTGFFVELLRNRDVPVGIWKDLIEGEVEAVCSALTLFELERLGLKGVMQRRATKALLEAIPATCSLVWLDDEQVLSLGARLSHGLGIPGMDALILACLVQAGASIIYTTDRHLESYRNKTVQVVNLKTQGPAQK